MSFAPSDGPDPMYELASASQTVLVVDPDRVARRAVETALAPFGWAIEGVKNGAGALELLRQQHVDAIVAEIALDDMPARALIDRTWEVCGSSIPAFVFLTSDARLDIRTGILRGGADACIAKPFAPEELRAHLDGALIRRNRERQEPLAPTVAMAGHADQLDVAEVLALLERGRHTGVFEISVGSALGRLLLRDGRLVGAEFGSARGELAFQALIRCRRGYYRFDVRPVEGAPVIGRSIRELVEASGHDARRARTRARSLSELGITKREIPLHRGLPPVIGQWPPERRGVVQQLLGAVADRYLLGELSFEEPAGPERRPDERVIVELWAGLRDGVAALLELATPPGRDLVVSALEGAAHGLRLQLAARGGAAMTVLLVDIEGGDAPPRPHPVDLILVAPPRGELLAISPPRMAELSLMATLDRLPWIVAMGRAALHASLGKLAFDRASLDLLDVAATLGERRGQLREALVAVLRRWLA